MKALLAALAVLAACSSNPPPAPIATTPPPTPIEVADAGESADASVAAPTPEPAVIQPPPPAPLPVHPPMKLTGRCVDPLRDAKARGHWPKDVDLAQEPARVDLDGDGQDDYIFTVGADAAAYSGSVYLARGNCGVMVLAWKGSAPSAAQTRTRDVLDLEVDDAPCKAWCCKVKNVTTYRWSGQTYERGPTRTETRLCQRP